MIKIDKTDKMLDYPILYNGYPIINEVHYTIENVNSVSVDNFLLLDNYYGRFFTDNILNGHALYGNTNNMNFYNSGAIVKNKVVEELRVPYRRIPIYECTELSEIESMFSEVQIQNPDYRILLRGQNKLYTIQRSEKENYLLFGDESAKEPSFLPSFLRQDYDELFLQSVWNNIASMLLSKIASESQDLNDKLLMFRQNPYFQTFSLAIAQHYGLPSVGLDLTDDLRVALWFALNTIDINGDGHANNKLVDDDDESIIFIFRCPQDTVFKYHNWNIENISENSRPELQHAWFNHVGWGLSKNQMALHLVCGFKVSKEWNNRTFSSASEIFPNRETDYILDFFLKLIDKRINKDCKTGKMLSKIYHF